MKRMWNVAALGAVIVIGLGTFAFDMRDTKAEWDLAVTTNPEVWKDQTVNLYYNTEEGEKERFEVTIDQSQVTTDLNYIEQALAYDDEVDSSVRDFYRQLSGLSFVQSIQTPDGYIGIGQDGNKEIAVFRLNGQDVTKQIFGTDVNGASELMDSPWAGLFVRAGNVHVIYRDGYGENPVTKIAMIDEGAKQIKIETVKLQDEAISSVTGTSWAFRPYVATIDADNRFIPVSMTEQTSVTEGGETYLSEQEKAGLHAYDVETKQVVELMPDGDMWNATVYEDQLIALQEGGTELVVDLKTGKQSTRQVIDGSVGTTSYVGDQLYHARPTKEGAVIDVYQDGKAISSAVVKATNDEAKALLPSTQFYVE
ncbi:hypothetical protein [Exiguobacterium chiriqhucha]|uniref:Uncharacterized protein n=1 Tax=Exiguobacterium chiriqhucha RW-2 TaxID=1345023 RepID=U1N028_9BACL|nr:hypothetical protein [Exiguobacterium chiriqhucha]ERG66080.1 hypothetical protein M467_02255 [Exiguobacterium chiriqhucha RW-2]